MSGRYRPGHGSVHVTGHFHLRLSVPIIIACGTVPYRVRGVSVRLVIWLAVSIRLSGRNRYAWALPHTCTQTDGRTRGSCVCIWTLWWWWWGGGGCNFLCFQLEETGTLVHVDGIHVCIFRTCISTPKRTRNTADAQFRAHFFFCCIFWRGIY